MNDGGSSPDKDRESLRHNVQTVSGAQPASYPIGIRGSFPGGEAAGA
jgi:hypothetical protein